MTPHPHTPSGAGTCPLSVTHASKHTPSLIRNHIPLSPSEHYSLAPRSTMVHASLSAQPLKWIMRSSPTIISSISAHRPSLTPAGSSNVLAISPPAGGRAKAETDAAAQAQAGRLGRARRLKDRRVQHREAARLQCYATDAHHVTAPIAPTAPRRAQHSTAQHSTAQQAKSRTCDQGQPLDAVKVGVLNRHHPSIRKQLHQRRMKTNDGRGGRSIQQQIWCRRGASAVGVAKIILPALP